MKFQEMMKVNEGENESGSPCDFCGFYAAKFSINGGLWWICSRCMDLIYDGCTCTEDLQLVHHGECKYAVLPGGEEE